MALEAEACPNCGAPLELDGGRCRWCHSVVRRVGPVDLPAPGSFIVEVIDFLIDEPAVRRVVVNDALGDATRLLRDAITAAGRRVSDRGLLLGGRVDVKIYQAEEIWTFNLGADLAALFAGVDNLAKAKRVQARDLLGGIDAYLDNHWCWSKIGNAGAGPAALQQLREAVPRRTRTKF